MHLWTPVHYLVKDEFDKFRVEILALQILRHFKFVICSVALLGQSPPVHSKKVSMRRKVVRIRSLTSHTKGRLLGHQTKPALLQVEEDAKARWPAFEDADCGEGHHQVGVCRVHS
jgi:hypothetical protein